MTSSAISGQQMLKKEYGKSPARVNGLLKRLCGAETAEKVFSLDVKTQLLGDKANPGRPTDGRLDPCS